MLTPRRDGLTVWARRLGECRFTCVVLPRWIDQEPNLTATAEGRSPCSAAS
jgi:hypothetical protein